MLGELLIRKRMFVVLAAIALLVSCSNGDYDTPSTTATATVVSAETVNGYVSAGLVNGTGYDRVVILDVTSSAGYSAGHIPGAFFVNSAEVSATRSEGVIYAVNMVLDGPSIDALIQRAGINKNTTVIFTGPGTSKNDYMSVGRLYFNFRYWGFPKERLKVLNGLDGAYKAQYGLDTAVPAITASTYSVRNNRSFRDDLRVSLQEMLDYADGKVSNVVVIDGRGADGPGGAVFSYDGDAKATPGVFPAVAGDYVAFEGHIKGATAMLWSSLYEGIDSAGTVTTGTAAYYRFKSEADMVPLWTAAGLDSTKTAYVHCRTGMISSAMYVAIDAYLGWPVANYDGSWSQWGHLAGKENGGFLENNSPWRTDVAARTESLYLNRDAAAIIEDPLSGGAMNSFDNSANKIEEADKAYFGAGGSAGSGGGGTPHVGC
ncbi:MAG: selenite/tellurite reduction operon rhodanese-like protein ExtH [Nitrospirota bacterium]